MSENAYLLVLGCCRGSGTDALHNQRCDIDRDEDRHHKDGRNHGILAGEQCCNATDRCEVDLNGEWNSDVRRQTDRE